MPFDLDDYLQRHIPLTRAMGIRLVSWDDQALTLAAPLAPNVNDKGTAFAGSLASLITLSGWALTQLLVAERGLEAQVAVFHSELDYLKPVRTDLEARCYRPGAQTEATFLDTLTRRGKARWELAAVILADGQEAVRLKGHYAAWTPARTGPAGGC